MNFSFIDEKEKVFKEMNFQRSEKDKIRRTRTNTKKSMLRE